MTSTVTRRKTWYNMLEVVRLARYYEAMSNRYRSCNQIIRTVLLVSATGITADVFNFLPFLPAAVQEWTKGILGILVIVAIVAEFVMEFGSKAELLRLVSAQCSELTSEWEKLWADLNSPDANDDDIRFRDAELDARLTIATDRADAKVTQNKKVNRASVEPADKWITTRFGDGYLTS